MLKDNKCDKELSNRSGFSNNSFCYPLSFSFKNLSSDEVIPLLEDIFKSYNVEFVRIRRKGGFSH